MYDLIQAAIVGAAAGISTALASGLIDYRRHNSGQACGNRAGQRPIYTLHAAESGVTGIPEGIAPNVSRRYDCAKAVIVGLTASLSASATSYIIHRLWPNNGRILNASEATSVEPEAAGVTDEMLHHDRPFASASVSRDIDFDSAMKVGRPSATSFDDRLPAEVVLSSSFNATGADSADNSAVEAAVLSVSVVAAGVPANTASQPTSSSPETSSQAKSVVSKSKENALSPLGQARSTDNKSNSKSSSQQLCTQLRLYYAHNVQQTTNDVKDSRRIVTSEIGHICEFINGKDSRFHRNPIAAGGMKESLNVDTADEFDYNIKLNHNTSDWRLGAPSATSLENSPQASVRHDSLVMCSSSAEGFGSTFPERLWTWSKHVMDPMSTIDKEVTIIRAATAADLPPAGYTCVLAHCLAGQEWKSFCHENVVVPFYIRRTLHKLVEQGIKVENRPSVPGVQDLKLKYKQSGPAITLAITRDQGTQIHVDLCPYFDLPHVWPLCTDWPRLTTSSWLSQDKIVQIKAKGIQLVPKRNFDFRISFSLAEIEIFDGIDADLGCRRKCLRIMKCLNEREWCKTIKPEVSSYVLKNLLLWECERSPSRQEWADDMLWERLHSLTELLLSWIKDKCAPQYFYPAVNLFANSDLSELGRVGKLVQKFLDDPSKYLIVEPSRR